MTPLATNVTMAISDTYQDAQHVVTVAANVAAFRRFPRISCLRRYVAMVPTVTFFFWFPRLHCYDGYYCYLSTMVTRVTIVRKVFHSASLCRRFTPCST